MNTFDKIKAAWKARQIFNTIEKERKRMGDYDFKKTAAKAAKDFLITALAVASASAGAALGEYFSSRENIEAAIAVLPSPMIAVLVPLISAAAVALANWAKHRKGAAIVPLLILALASPAFAQEQAPKSNSVTFSSGATRFFTPGIGDATELEGQVLVQVDAPNFFVVEGFARFTRMQGSEPGLDGLLDSSSFRAAVGHLSVHRVLGGPTFMGGQLPFFGAGCSAGVSWERDKVFDPSDPNIWAVGCGPRVQLPRGSLTVKVGHHGSVGGFAAFGELVINQGPSVRYVATYAVPFDAARFRQNPGTFTGGIQVDVWSRKF